MSDPFDLHITVPHGFDQKSFDPVLLQRYCIAIEGIKDGIWERDLLNDTIWYSPRFKELLGFEDHEIPNDRSTINSRIHPEDAPRFYEGYKNAVKALDSFSVELRILHKDGDYRWFKLRAKVWADMHGNPTKLVGAVTDIQQQKSVEAALKQLTERFERAISATNDGLFERYADSDEFMFSPRVFELLGFADGELSTQRGAILTRVHPEDIEYLRKGTSLGIAQRRRWTLEYRMMCKSGEYRWFRERAGITLDDSGRQLISGVIADIHQEKSAKEELSKHRDHLAELVNEKTASLKTAKEEAERANEAKSQFLANMSHEIRTPMHGVLGMLELLRSGMMNPQEKRYADVAYRSAQSLLSVINDILDFSKIEAGKLELESIEFELRPVIEGSCEILMSKVRDKGLEFSCTIAEEAPATLCGDPGRMSQILTNLIGNAVKFTERGRIDVTVQVHTHEDLSNHLVFEIADTGIGMSAETQKNLFTPFMQADSSTTRRFGGTGLGLAITKQLVDLLKGRISVQSEPDKGSRFRLEIPVTHFDPSVTHATLRRDSLKTEPAPKPATRHTASLLIVEDNAVNRIVAEAMLTEMGFQIQVACNGLEALELCAVHAFDIILMDCQMPVMDGFEAVRRLRTGIHDEKPLATFAQVPVVALTANAFKGDSDRCIAAGFNDYLSKPYAKTQLGDTLGRWVPLRT